MHVVVRSNNGASHMQQPTYSGSAPHSVTHSYARVQGNSSHSRHIGVLSPHVPFVSQNISAAGAPLQAGSAGLQGLH
jgi:hypothetical protein